MKKVLILILITVFVVGSLFAGGKKEGEKIIVGTSAGFRPFEYREKGVVTGFDIDLMTEIGKAIGKEVVVQDMDFDALIEAVSTGTIDVIAAGMTITDERAKRIDFTVPYFTADQAVLVRENTDIKGYSIEDLNNSSMKIGVQTDTTGSFWVQDNAPDATLQQYGKYIECIQDLENQNIDLIVVDKPVASAYEANRPVKVAYVIETNEQYGLGLKKGSDLYESVNGALKELMKSPTWDKLMSKYFGE